MRRSNFFPAGIFLVALILGAQNCKPVMAEKEKSANSILLVLTGFISPERDISLARLKLDYCSNEVFVLKADAEIANHFFQCKSKKILEKIQAFSKLAKTNLLIASLENSSYLYKALSIGKIDYFENPSQYPLVFKTEGANGKSPQLTKISITGVTALTRASGRIADEKGPAFLLEKIKAEFAKTDILHISNEVSFTPDCVYPAQKTYRFCTKKEHFSVLLDLGMDIVELTGNHNRDFGDQPFVDTYQWYQQNNIKIFGGGLNPQMANQPLIITLADGKKIAFLGFNETCPIKECALKANEPGANFYEKSKAEKTIRQLRRQKIDFIIVSVQFSEVDSYQPHAKQRQVSYDLIDMGADMVYGSQAHQVQQIEFYKSKPIFHGLGNFLFDQIHRIGVRQAYFMHLFFYQGRPVQTKLVFTFMNEQRQIVQATNEEQNLIEKEIFSESLIYH